jgi:Carboxymuconolactone decarboxylase family
MCRALTYSEGDIAGALDPHVRELAILVACRETNYSLEWNAHDPAAVKAGVDRKTIDVVRRIWR